MDVRAQVSMVFHLDKCIGCHTCSIACKNIWTDRKGAEYMWWNNVETKPGTGYPTAWEDQARYNGGWERHNGSVRLKTTGKVRGLTNIFFNPDMPTVDDYYEPWSYRYQDLFNAPAGDDQPTARPISLITGRNMEKVEAGPNWDDDLGGSPVYAANDPNLANLTAEDRARLFQVERLVFFYLPRICNHCLNPACVAACPSGAMYKRAEDGIVLINQDKCRAWRACVSACPYKKVYYNWASGKSEKCILCYPRQETGQAPACFHSCVGRIRYLGVLLYDASGIQATAAAPDRDRVAAQRELILNPFDPSVIAGARRNGIGDQWLKAAQDSPVYKFVKLWKLALPLHTEFGTIPMLYYVPSLLPVLGVDHGRGYDIASEDFFGVVEEARLPLRYLANLFSAGNEEVVAEVLRKLLAVRVYMRSTGVGDVDQKRAAEVITRAGCPPEEVEQIYRLTSLAGYDQRHAMAPYQREVPVGEIEDVRVHKGETGVGSRSGRRREF